MGRAARTKTSNAAVKHTLKHARSPEGLVVGIEALGLHEAASDDEDLEAVAASLSSSVDAVAASLRAAHRSRDGARASGGARFAGLVRASGRRRLGLARCHRPAKRRDALPLAEISVRQGSGSSLRVVS